MTPTNNEPLHSTPVVEYDALIVRQIARTAAIGVSRGCGHAQYIDFAIADSVVAALAEAGLLTSCPPPAPEGMKR